jgi:hypothetical protein
MWIQQGDSRYDPRLKLSQFNKEHSPRRVPQGDSMVASSTHYLVLALVLSHLACVVIAIVLFTLIPPSYYLPLWPRWQTVFLEGLAISQICLLATWLGIGMAPLAARLGSVVFLIAFWVTMFDWLTLDHENWFKLFVILAFGVGGGLSLTRIIGLTLSNYSTKKQSVDRRSIGRYTVWQMLSWLTIVAFLLYLVTIGREHRHTPLDYMKGPRSLALGLSFVLVTLVTVWAYLRNRGGLIPALLALLVVVLASLTVGKVDTSVRQIAFSTLHPKSHEAAYWCMVSFASLLLHISLTWVRYCGYRLVKRPGVS